MDDVRAIMDDVGSRQAVLLGLSEGAAMGALFAATYPERVSHLILFGGYTRSFRTEETILERAKLWAREPPRSKGLCLAK
jgi:pimeloyl-ACP methyl ester carboxylesterase